MARIRSPKWLKWEFWPYWFFYLPVYGYWIYLSVRARSFTFFTAANPAMRFGGFVDYSKYDILARLPAEICPPSHLFPHKPKPSEVLAVMEDRGLDFPVILKPDRGERGFAVAKIEGLPQLSDYLTAAPEGLVLQAYVDLPQEFGVLYHRLPGAPGGAIHSVVQKEFLVIWGDGRSTLEQLFAQGIRTRYHLPMLRSLYADRLAEVLAPGEQLELVAIGNHARGTTFRNANHLITPGLVEVFDRYSQQVEGYYFGRYDLRAQSMEHVLRGEFRVVELNGANSEPAHIYDPEYPLMRAYRDLFRHWRTLYRVSMAVRRTGYRPVPLSELVRAVRKHIRYKREQNRNSSKT